MWRLLATPPAEKGWVMALLGSRPLGLAGVYSQDVESWVLRERKAPRHAGCGVSCVPSSGAVGRQLPNVGLVGEGVCVC